MSSTLHDIKNKLVQSNLVSRGDAITIDALVNNKLSDIVHINSFTEQPSSVNLDIALSIIDKELLDNLITLDMKEMKNIISILKKNLKLIKEYFNIPMSASKYFKILDKDTKIDGKQVGDFTISEFIENNDKVFELLEVEGLPIFKLVTMAEIEAENGDTNILIRKCVDKNYIDEDIILIEKLIAQYEEAMMKDPVFKLAPYTVMAKNTTRFSSALLVESILYFASLLEK